MRLAVITNSEGQIYGLAVCQATFDNNPDTTREVSIHSQPLHGGDLDGASFQTHIVALPSHLVGKTYDEMGEGLRYLHESMYLDLTESEPSLREHLYRYKSAD